EARRIRRPSGRHRDQGRGDHARDGRDLGPGGRRDVRQGRHHHRPARARLLRRLLRG
ncbi:MAG: Ribosomal silencing factor RsfA, partial [uncultured Rubrobacteraceae bacterium]